MSPLTYPLHYPAFSTVDEAGLKLVTAAGPEVDGDFFQGRLCSPDRDCTALLTVARIAQTRFYTPPGMLQRILREADPVITSDGRGLRLEAFSPCCGVHGRLDLGPGAIDGTLAGRGTTNVDFNPPMREALTHMSFGDKTVSLSVGHSEFRASTDGSNVVEKKVPLPNRWLRSFGESQALASELELKAELTGVQARSFLRAVPKSVGGSDVVRLVPGAKNLRLSQRGSGGFEVGGVGRVRLLDPLARFIDRLLIFAHPNTSMTAWVAHLGGSTLELLLSPTASRAFSGEGQLLERMLSQTGVSESVAAVRAQLTWAPSVDRPVLEEKVGVSSDSIERSLAILSTQGVVGFSVHQQSYFRRELPFDDASDDKHQTRLRAARELVASGAVEIRTDSPFSAFVLGSGSNGAVEYLVRADPQWSCNCVWHLRTRGNRGPCKHILACKIAKGE
ncbi:MAG: SWIM zinc finger family protein [Myxococcota bacterium]